MSVRRATHAGSWYSGSAATLGRDLDGYFATVPDKLDNVYESLPVKGTRLVVGPHAGYAYAGPTLARTYRALDLTGIRRLFILGPSHHVYFRGARVSPFAEYATPFGNLQVDVDTTNELLASGIVDSMSQATDEREHSFEMHMPFLYRVAESAGAAIPKIVPILIGASTAKFEDQLARALVPYLADKSNAFAISTDFCHWGDRFDYTVYTDGADGSNLQTLPYTLKASSGLNPKVPIYKSIEYLDRLGMEAATNGYAEFGNYIDKTENTICGRHPLAILLRTIELAKVDSKLKWTGYAQSSKVRDVSGSSVSYASGFA